MDILIDGAGQSIITPGGPPFMPSRSPPPNFSLFCKNGYWGVLADFQEGGFPQLSVYADLPDCPYVYSYNKYTTINGDRGSLITPGTDTCPKFILYAGSYCFPSYTCDTCVSALTEDDDPFDMNTPVAVGTETTLYDLLTRSTDYTRTVVCSGYMQKDACFEFGEWTVTLTP